MNHIVRNAITSLTYHPVLAMSWIAYNRFYVTHEISRLEAPSLLILIHFVFESASERHVSSLSEQVTVTTCGVPTVWLRIIVTTETSKMLHLKFAFSEARLPWYLQSELRYTGCQRPGHPQALVMRSLEQCVNEIMTDDMCLIDLSVLTKWQKGWLVTEVEMVYG
jgi:hypothetical protein